MRHIKKPVQWPPSLALACIVVSALAASVANSAVASGSKYVYFAQSNEPAAPVYRPPTLVVSATGAFDVVDVRWRSWTRTSARGSGTGLRRQVDGNRFRGPVAVQLSRPRHRCGSRVFTRGVFTFTRRTPKGTPRRWTLELATAACPRGSS